jgi:hypothetical protein
MVASSRAIAGLHKTRGRASTVETEAMFDIPTADVEQPDRVRRRRYEELMGTERLRLVTSREHGAQFTRALLDALPDEWLEDEHGVLDPFAGPGTRLGAWCDRHGLVFAGFDIEVWPRHDSRVAQADATDPASYPEGDHLVVTSPTYGNGINDHFTPKDPNRRDNTYRTWLGHDLHENNSGRYTVRHGGSKEVRYWEINLEAVTIWAHRGFDALVNVKDFPYSGGVYPLVARWVELLEAHDYRVAERLEVETPGIRYGANTDTVADHEVWLRALRPTS